MYVCICKCIFKLLSVENVLGHGLQKNNFSPLWVVSSVSSNCFVQKMNWNTGCKKIAAPQYEPLCVSSKYFNQKMLPTENFLGHLLQENGFSPVWVLKCCVKLPCSEKAFKHWLQEYVFSSIWVFICLFKSPPWEKALGHWLQENGFSPVYKFLNVLLKYFLH